MGNNAENEAKRLLGNELNQQDQGMGMPDVLSGISRVKVPDDAVGSALKNLLSAKANGTQMTQIETKKFPEGLFVVAPTDVFESARAALGSQARTV